MPNNNDMPELLPCPIDGGEIEHHTDTGFHYGSYGGYKPKSEDFQCKSCGLKLSVRGDDITKEQAFAKWNTRADKAAESVQDVMTGAIEFVKQKFKELDLDVIPCGASIRFAVAYALSHPHQAESVVGDIDINALIDEITGYIDNLKGVSFPKNHVRIALEYIKNRNLLRETAPKQEPVNAEREPFKLEITKEWCENMARNEPNCDISACSPEIYAEITRAQAEPIKVEVIDGLEDAIYYVESDGCFALNDDGTQKPSSRSYELGCLVRTARAYLRLQQQTMQRG